uniref:Venom polypeptide n=1 Tax=Dolopus genitalis TaxID=2488630 RepID=A0A3G5BID0_DOLGE|nr:venom polypeptide [Dolopus genitalis]
MKFFLLLVAFVAIVEATFAYKDVYHSPTPVGENAGKCIFEGKEMQKGYTQVSGCRVITCYKDGSYTYRGCPKVNVEGCTKGEFVDESLRYPHCCRWKWTCHDDKKGIYIISK